MTSKPKKSPKTVAASLIMSEIRQFLETTSVRGIPRVLKSQCRGVCLIWLLAVMTCTAALVWQVTIAFQRYFQYPVNTVVVQVSDTAPTFPDISICNPAKLVDLPTSSFRYEDYVRLLNQQLSLEAINNTISNQVANVKQINSVINYFY